MISANLSTPLHRLLYALTFTVSVASISMAEPTPSADLSHENFGGISLGDLLSDVIRKIGPPADMSKAFEDSVNRCTKRVYFYNNGLELETCKTEKREEIYSLRIVKKPQVATARNMRAGVSTAEVLKAYPKHTLRGTHAIIVSDTRSHLTLRFLLEDDKVYEISLYRDRRAQKLSNKKPLLIKRRRNVFH